MEAKSTNGIPQHTTSLPQKKLEDYRLHYCLDFHYGGKHLFLSMNSLKVTERTLCKCGG